MPNKNALGEGEEVREARLVGDALVVQHGLQHAQRVHVEEHGLQCLLLPPGRLLVLLGRVPL